MNDEMTSPSSQLFGPLTIQAERLCGIFKMVAERELSTMSASARLVLRAWAEAELAVLAARQSGEPSAQTLLSAEAFRTRPYIPREEIGCEEIVCRVGYMNQPIHETSEQENSYVSWPRAKYHKVTYLEAQHRIDAAPFAESISIPSVVAGGNVGWEPIKHYDPLTVLNLLNKLEAGHTEYPSERMQTTEYDLVCHVSHFAKSKSVQSETA